jgi:PhzF family phenazine biosynthesis protein
MNELPLYIIDAFTGIPFRGNPASVCLLERGLPETTMQMVTGEMKHSETAFAPRPRGQTLTIDSTGR